ncbi:MAG: nucleotidyltransferase domain-containing protein [Candidatus Margulisiibacteriota bacterium]
MRNIKKREIKKVVSQAAEKINPEKVILFGSYAYGKPNKDSDVDLLFITNTELKGLKRYRWVNQYVSHIFPIDLIIKTPSEIKQRLSMGDPFYKEIISKGKTLYESR